MYSIKERQTESEEVQERKETEEVVRKAVSNFLPSCPSLTVALCAGAKQNART